MATNKGRCELLETEVGDVKEGIHILQGNDRMVQERMQGMEES